MAIVRALEKLLSSQSMGAFGYPGGFGSIRFGLSVYGYYEQMAGVYQRRRGIQGTKYVRMDFTIAPNPRTLEQQTWRGVFTDGVVHWQGLTDSEKGAYNVKAKRLRMSGFNLHQREWLASHSI